MHEGERCRQHAPAATKPWQRVPVVGKPLQAYLLASIESNVPGCGAEILIAVNETSECTIAKYIEQFFDCVAGPNELISKKLPKGFDIPSRRIVQGRRVAVCILCSCIQYAKSMYGCSCNGKGFMPHHILLLAPCVKRGPPHTSPGASVSLSVSWQAIIDVTAERQPVYPSATSSHAQHPKP